MVCGDGTGRGCTAHEDELLRFRQFRLRLPAFAQPVGARESSFTKVSAPGANFFFAVGEDLTFQVLTARWRILTPQVLGLHSSSPHHLLLVGLLLM